MRRIIPSQSRPYSALRAFATILLTIFVVDQINMSLIDHDWEWRESVTEAGCLTIICLPLLWFLAFLPLRRALLQQQEKAVLLEAAYTELAFIHSAFQASETKYRGMFENSPLGIYQMNAVGDLLTINPAYADLMGYASRGGALRGNHADTYLIDGQFRELLQAADQTRGVIRQESQVRRPDGRVIWVSENLCPSYDAAGVLQFYDGSLQDITERKLAQEADASSRRTLQSVIDNIPQFIFWKDTSSTYLGCNRNFAQLAGLEAPEDVLGRSDFDLFPQEDAQKFRSDDRRVMAANAPELGFVEDWSKNDVPYWAETNKIPLYGPNGELVGLLATATDITVRVRHEEQLREREAALRRTNSMLLAQQEATLDGILIIDENQRLVSFNSHYCRMWNIPAELVAAGDESAVIRHISGLIADLNGFLDQVRYLADHPEESSEDEILLRDGRIFERYSVPVTAEDGQNNGRVLYFRDITARKQAVEDIRTSRQMLKSVLDNIPELIFWKDRDSKYVGCNRNYATWVGLEDPTEIIGLMDHDVFADPEHVDLFRSQDQRVMETDTSDLHFVETWSLDTGQIWTETSKIPLHDAAGSVIGVLGTAIEITERVQAVEEAQRREAVLQRTNSLLLAQQEANIDGLLIVDESRRIVHFNQRFCEMWAVPAELAGIEGDDPFLHHVVGQVQNADAFLAKVEHLYVHPHEHSHDEIFLRDGRVLERRSVPVTAVDGRDNGRVWQFRDVTEQKLAEQERHEREATLHRQNSILVAQQEATLDSILIVDENQKIISFNRRFCELWGIPDDMIAAHKSGVDTPLLQWAVGQVADPETYLSKVQHLYAHPHEWSEDEVLLHDGRVFERSSVPVIAADGCGIGRIWYNRDITARKRVEEDLRTSREMLRSIVENIPQSVFWKDVNSVYLGCNQNYANNCLLETPEDVVGKSVYDLMPSEEADDFFAADQRVIETDTPEYRSIKKTLLFDGREMWTEISKVPLHDKMGRVVGILGTLEDITERIQAQEEIRASREMLQTVMDNVPQNIMWRNRAGVIVGCNQSLARLHGLTPSEMIGHSLQSLNLPMAKEQAGLLDQADDRAMADDQARYHVVELLVMPNGERRWSDFSKIPLHDAAGDVNGLLVSFEDITERKRAEEDLRASREMLRTVMDNIPQLIFWKNTASVYVGCNKNFAHAAGLDCAEDLVGKTDYELFWKPEETEWFRMIDRRVMDSDTAELRIIEPQIRADGTETWVETNKIPLHDGEGKVVGILGTFEDITERKRAEEERHEREAMLHWQNSLLLAQQEATLDGVLIVDENRHIVRINRRFCEMFHVPDDLAAAGDDVPVLRYTVGQYVDPVASTLKIEALYADTEERSQEELPLRDGRIFERRSVPVTAQDGRSNGRVWYFRDVTEQRLSEEALRQARDQAEAASRAKSQFLANMSHELRTPMNAVIGFSEILQDQAFGPLNPRQTKYVGNILSSGRHLLQLINDILDITKIEAGRMTLDLEPLAVAEAVEGVHSVVKALSMKKKIEILLEIEDQMSVVNADSACFKQILYNLFSNAIKFTPESGRVRLSAWCHDGTLHVSVSDTGIGIAPEDQARVWGEFEQVDSTYARTQQGTGLGLALTRRLVELHGGRIWMKSEGVGKGSVFQFTIPLGATETRNTLTETIPAGTSQDDAPADDESPGDEGTPWVLLVDDDPQASELMTHCLEEVGYAVSRVDDGEQALFLALLSRPCAILLDIEMPGKDGWTVLSELKSDPRTQDIPVVIVSVDQDRPRALHLGAVDCFTKPVDRVALVRTLRHLRGATPVTSLPLREKREINA